MESRKIRREYLSLGTPTSEILRVVLKDPEKAYKMCKKMHSSSTSVYKDLKEVQELTTYS